MCTHKGKQLGLGARRGLWGDSLRDPCESVFGSPSPWLPDCLQNACTLIASEEGMVCLEAAGAKGRPGDTHRRRGWSSGSTLWCVGTTAALLGGFSAGAPHSTSRACRRPCPQPTALSWPGCLPSQDVQVQPQGACARELSARGTVRAGPREEVGLPPEAEPHLLREGRDICL